MRIGNLTVLNLTLKKNWFDMVACNEKKEEYRDVKQYWINRLTWHEFHNYKQLELIAALRNPNTFRKDYDAVLFKNGYGKKSPSVMVELEGIHYGFPKHGWIEESEYNKNKFYFCLRLGEIINQ